jgi:hypothetical protein
MIINGYDYMTKDIRAGRIIQITEAEAERKVKTGETVLLRVRKEDFPRVKTESELNNHRRLHNMGIYDLFEFYTEDERKKA